MEVLMILLVFSVFLGTELLAVPLPGFQLSLYRMTLFLGIFLTIYQAFKHHPQLKIDRKLTSHWLVIGYLCWWLWGFLSVLWAMSFGHWLRAMFLLTLGISAIVLVYLWVHDMNLWRRLIRAMWLGMSILMFWGYYELLTNHYLFADLNKLDKHGTFASQPLTRIPVTVFENQNDYATMLLAFLTVCMIGLSLTKFNWQRLILLGQMLLASYLVFRCESRMILLSFILIIVIKFLLQFKVDLKLPQWRKIVLVFILLIAISIALVPAIQNKIDTLFYVGYGEELDGDTVRMNLWRNGLHFLGQTFGLGVGAGNIEFWMNYFRELPTKIITNMHNWWLEILVAYGWPAFCIYVTMYGVMIRRLFTLRSQLIPQWRAVNNNLMAFLIVYIFASITSASNMLIEWHWVFFAVIIAYINIIENQLKYRQKGREYEFINDYR
ncbi:O-antigen ligase [Ignavigranum ruoffiae]|uniref:O-antigen ligase n=1 Tax=Ignavigranum ruoffiae TaxID=89093 RepID=A0A1H9DVS8_9LACT|nr:O-antigen ligase family protein [Ignavigranum ruoffiae]SEQ17492.1 O-antigen ligase [Ignavigranum ruoffiae]